MTIKAAITANVKTTVKAVMSNEAPKEIHIGIEDNLVKIGQLSNHILILINFMIFSL